MKIKLIAIGKKMPTWVDDGYHDYAKRLPREFSVELVSLPLGSRQKGSDISRAIAREGQQMLGAIPAGDQVIALDVKGQRWSTEKLSQKIHAWRNDSVSCSLLIGGPDGLAEPCRQKAHHHWSLSDLTLPHPLVRILVIEQLYRAWTILQNHPYHK